MALRVAGRRLSATALPESADLEPLLADQRASEGAPTKPAFAEPPDDSAPSRVFLLVARFPWCIRRDHPGRRCCDVAVAARLAHAWPTRTTTRCNLSTQKDERTREQGSTVRAASLHMTSASRRYANERPAEDGYRKVRARVVQVAGLYRNATASHQVREGTVHK